MLEMYDFMVFGYYASAIGHTFFPGSGVAALLKSFMTFGAGFLMRPLGAIVLGAYLDRKGRRSGLLVTLALMSVGTISIACVPGYRTIGVLAPLLVLTGRLLQGFSAGVELGGVSVYLSEIATPGHRGFYVSWQSASQQVSVILAALIGVALNSNYTPARMDAFGWRIPLLIGCLIIPLLLLLRRSLPETAAFTALPARPSAQALAELLVQNSASIAAGVLLVTFTTVSFYFITAYTPTFGTRELHLTARASLVVTLAVGLSNLVWLPVMGALSDRIGRRPILAACATLALCTAYPLVAWLVRSPSFARLLAAELWLSTLYAGYNGAMVVYLTEIMPAAAKTSGFSLAYSLATALFGGFTPFVSTYLIHATHNKAMPAVWLSAAAICALLGLMITAERSRIRPG